MVPRNSGRNSDPGSPLALTLPLTCSRLLPLLPTRVNIYVPWQAFLSREGFSAFFPRRLVPNYTSRTTVDMTCCTAAFFCHLGNYVVPFHLEGGLHDALQESLEPRMVLRVDEPVLEHALALVAPKADQLLGHRHGLVAAHQHTCYPHDCCGLVYTRYIYTWYMFFFVV